MYGWPFNKLPAADECEPRLPPRSKAPTDEAVDADAVDNGGGGMLKAVALSRLE